MQEYPQCTITTSSCTGHSGSALYDTCIPGQENRFRCVLQVSNSTELSHNTSVHPLSVPLQLLQVAEAIAVLHYYMRLKYLIIGTDLATA